MPLHDTNRMMPPNLSSIIGLRTLKRHKCRAPADWQLHGLGFSGVIKALVVDANRFSGLPERKATKVVMKVLLIRRSPR